MPFSYSTNFLLLLYPNFIIKKHGNCEKKENTGSLPPPAFVKRVENEDKACDVHQRDCRDMFVLSRFIYVRQAHVGNVFRAFRFKSN